MLIQRVTNQRSVAKSGVRYISGAQPLSTLVGRQVRLRNIKRSKSVGVIDEVISDLSEVTRFAKGMVPMTIRVCMKDTNTSQWVCEKDILKVMS